MQSQVNIIDKKKRTSPSGSRSKSKKSTNNIKHQQTVQLKPKPLHIFHNQDICAKIKTQNSLSVNKSKGSRKNSKSFKKPIKSVKQSKDQSYLVSAERKHSINKINRTQTTHLQSQDIYKKLYSIKKHLSKIELPSNFSIASTLEFFNQIKQSFLTISIQPLESIFLLLHSMYLNPIQNIFSIIKPYETMLRKKQQMAKLIRQQLQENQKLYTQLDSDDLQIMKLKDKINKNAHIISSIKKNKQNKQNQISMKKKKNSMSQQANHFDQSHPYQVNSFIYQSGSNLEKSQLSQKAKNHEQIEMKFVKQYQKVPRFLQQKRFNNFIGNNKENGQINQFDELDNKNIENYSFEVKKGKNKQQKQKRQLQKTQNDKLSKLKTFEAQQQDLGEIHQNIDVNENEVSQRLQQKFDMDQDQNVLQVAQNKGGLKSGGMSFNFKLDIPKIDKQSVGFHDEFYSKLDEFSESWRNQALREKRF